MDFAFSDEQEAFRETLRRFLAERAPLAETQRRVDAGGPPAPELWKAMAQELGLPGIAIPERFGGQGFGFLELAIVLEETGRVLLPAPLFASACLAAEALALAATDAQKEAWLPGIASGETVATLAFLEPGGDWDPASLRMAARREGPGWVLDGEKHFVLAGEDADLAVVAALADGEPALFAVRTDTEGVEAEALETLDPTRRQATLRFRRTRADLLGKPGAATIERVLQRGAIGLAAEMAGAAARCLESAVAYAKERRQFGRPIGSFQAIKHKCAEVLLEVESARSAAWWASWVAAEDGAELAQAAHLAKSFCADAYLLAARECIQIHGGIGFTWEASPHLFYRRAKVSESLLGDSAYHRARLADELLPSGP